MKHRKLLFTVLLVPVLLACQVFIGGPAYPTEPIPVSAAEVQSMQTQMAEALIIGAQTGIVTLKLTESQLTSLMLAKLLQQETPMFTEPQVLLRNNQMMVYGKIIRGSFIANMLITTSVSIDPESGSPKVEIVSADFGPFPAPEGLNAAINTMVAEAFTGSLGPVAIGFRLSSITIADGVMTMVGRIR